MASKLSKSKIIILGMFAVVAVYVGSLVVMNEPTPWRDVPQEGMSRNGPVFSEEIAELKLFYMPRRGFPFYFADERAHFEPLAWVADPATIKEILDMMQRGEPRAEPGCAPVKRDAMLHVITYRADGSVFGYVTLQAGRITPAGPADARDCTIAWMHRRDELVSWEVYDARTGLTEITGVAM